MTTEKLDPLQIMRMLDVAIDGCDIEDMSAEFRKIARECYDDYLSVDDFHAFYNKIGKFMCAVELREQTHNCMKHNKLFLLLSRVVVASYLKARLTTQPDSLFITVRNEFLDHFHTAAVMVADSLAKEYKR